MKIYFAILISSWVSMGSSDVVDTNFLTDFFEDKNCTIAANLCWNRTEIKYHQYNVIVGGDFNVSFNRGDPKANTLIDVMSTFNLSKVVNFCTHKHNCLDIIFTNIEQNKFWVSPENLNVSDHEGVALKVQYPVIPICSKTIYYRPATIEGQMATLGRNLYGKQISWKLKPVQNEGAFHYHVLNLENCQNSWRMLSMVNFKYPNKFLILVQEEQFDELTNILINLTVEVDSDVILAVRNRNSTILLKQFYRITLNNEIIWEEYGLWKENQLTEFPMEPIVLRRRNLRGAHVKFNYVFEHNETVEYIHTFRHPTIDIMAKQVYGPLINFIDICNMTYTIVQTDSYGYYNKTTGTFDGQVDSLHKKETLFSASPLLYTKERFRFVDFFKSMNPQLINLIYRRPPISYLTGIFTIAFQTSVWLCVISVLFLLGVGIYAVLKVENTFINKVATAGSISDVLLICLEAVCQQGTLTSPQSNAGMMLFFFVFFSYMLVYVAYSGIIIVILQSTRSLDNVEQLLHSKMEVGAMDTRYMPFYLTGTKDPIKQELYNKKIGPNGYYSMEEGLEKVRSGEFAFHMETAPAYHYALKHFTEDEVCSLQELEGYIPIYGYWPMQKNSPYIKIFKVATLHVAERGLQIRHHKRFVMTPKCFSTAASFKSVGMVEAYQIFFIFCWGLGASIFVLALEKLTFRMKKLKAMHKETNVIEHLQVTN